MKSTITVHNDDMVDLFVWVRDLLSYGQDIVLSEQRLSPDESVQIEVELDEDKNAKILWRAQRADDPSVSKESDALEVDDGDTVDVNVFGARATFVRTIEVKPKRLAATQVSDPKVFTLIEAIWNEKIAPKLKYRSQFISVESVALLWGSAIIDESQIKTIPSRVEEKTVEYLNDTDEPKPHEETLRVTTKRTVTLESSTKLTDSSELKVGLGFSIGVVKLNADIISKNSFEIGSKSTQSFSEEVTVETKEKWTVPARTRHVLTVQCTKGLVVAPVEGSLVIDANVRFAYEVLPNSGHYVTTKDSYPISAVLSNPADRQVEYDGTLVSESYEKTVVVHRDTPLNALLLEQLRPLEAGGWISSG